MLAVISTALRAEPTTGDLGGIGLLQVPTARMFDADTLATGFTWTPLYRHAFVTLQALPGVEMTLRQSGDAFAGKDGTEFSGGLDLKLRLLREGPHWPEISAGARGLFDDRGLSGQYLLMSRRWYDTDWTLGVGWGRFAQQGFLGSSVSPIGGVEIHLPADGPFSGVSLKVEYTGDRFRAERSRYADLPAPFPVNAGMVWRPLPWIEAGAAFEQGHAAMLRASLMLDGGRLDSGAPAKSPPQTIGPRPKRSKPRDAERRIQTALRSAGMPIQAVRIDEDQATVWLDSVPDGPPARTAGRVARIMAMRSPAEVERLTVVLGPAELAGSAVSILRADLERADRNAGSPAEIWRTTELDRAASAGGAPGLAADRWQGRITPRLEQSLSGRTSFYAYRTTLDLAVVNTVPSGFVGGAGLRFNLADNLEERLGTPDPRLPVVRSDVARYAAVPATVDHLYGAWLWSPVSDWHTRISGGYLDEMFSGFEGEVLYRPFGARWAAGVDGDFVAKRVPGNLIYVEPGNYATAHANLHYESNDGLIHGVLRAGRYLAGDLGSTIELSRRFEGGVRIGAYATLTNAGGRNFDQGISIRIPIGPLPLAGHALAPEIATRSLGRDAGQRVDQPLQLYDLTAAAGVGRIMGSWNRLME
jgi:hypothetical protein